VSVQRFIKKRELAAEKSKWYVLAYPFTPFAINLAGWVVETNLAYTLQLSSTSQFRGRALCISVLW